MTDSVIPRIFVKGTIWVTSQSPGDELPYIRTTAGGRAAFEKKGMTLPPKALDMAPAHTNSNKDDSVVLKVGVNLGVLKNPQITVNISVSDAPDFKNWFETQLQYSTFSSNLANIEFEPGPDNLWMLNHNYGDAKAISFKIPNFNPEEWFTRLNVNKFQDEEGVHYVDLSKPLEVIFMRKKTT